MKVSDFHRNRFLMKTAEWPCSCNKTQAPIRIECGVYRAKTSFVAAGPNTLVAISLMNLVMAGAVRKPFSETPSMREGGFKRSNRSCMRKAARTGHNRESLARANNFVSPLTRFFCVRHLIRTYTANARSVPRSGRRNWSRNWKSPSIKVYGCFVGNGNSSV